MNYARGAPNGRMCHVRRNCELLRVAVIVVLRNDCCDTGEAEWKSPKPAYWIYNWPNRKNRTQMSQMATVEEVEQWIRTCMSSSSTFQHCHIVNWDKLFGSSKYIYQLHTSHNPEIIQSHPILSCYKTYTPPNPLTGEQWLMPANETCFPNSIFIIKVGLLEIWEFFMIYSSTSHAGNSHGARTDYNNYGLCFSNTCVWEHVKLYISFNTVSCLYDAKSWLSWWPVFKRSIS